MSRIVVTGVGIICAIASQYKFLLPALQSCKHNMRKISLFETTNSCPVAQVEDSFIRKETSFRTLDLGFLAFEEAIENSKCGLQNTGLSFSTCTIGMPELEDNFIFLKNKKNTINDFDYTKALSVGEFAHKLAQKYRIGGSITSFSTACSSSSNALCHGFMQIQQGICNTAVVGGCDALCRLTYHGFQSLKVMAQKPCKPFDLNREGMNLGEGAGFVVLESLESARKRKAFIYGEILGIGMSADAYHMSSPSPEGKGAALAMKRALQNGKLSPEKIDYINAHGTGTMPNDIAESNAIYNVFGKHSGKVYVNSIKSYLGHTLGAAGIIGVISTLCSMQNHFIPPTLGLEQLDPKCNICIPPSKGLNHKICYALVNAFAFGGNNTSILLGQLDEQHTY